MPTNKRGRPPKIQGGKNLWIPAHLVWHVTALLEADKKEIRIVESSAKLDAPVTRINKS